MSMGEGVDVHFLQRHLRTDFCDTLPSIEYFREYPDLHAKLKRFDGDLIHVHNEPSDLGVIAKTVRPDLPMVFDCHDLELCRSGDFIDAEVGALGLCDAVIYPSKRYQEIAECAFPRLKTIPHAVIYPLVMKEHMEGIKQFQRINGIVYEGGISSEHAYRDWRPFAESLRDKRIPFHVFAAKMDSSAAVDNDYWNLGTVVYRGMTYTGMLDQLGRFDWGIIGSPVPDQAMDGAMPNKLFECMAAGVPVIALNAPDVADFVEENRIGVAVDTVDGIVDLYSTHKGYREQVERVRWDYCMESQADTLMNLYREVLGGKKDIHSGLRSHRDHAA